MSSPAVSAAAPGATATEAGATPTARARTTARRRSATPSDRHLTTPTWGQMSLRRDRIPGDGASCPPPAHPAADEAHDQQEDEEQEGARGHGGPRQRLGVALGRRRVHGDGP